MAIWQRAEQLTTTAIAFATTNLEYIAGFASAVLAVLLLHLYYHYQDQRTATRKRLFNQSIRGERWMTTPEEENLEKVLMSDMIVETLEDLKYRGKLSPERIQVWYKRFGNLLNLPDLLEKHEVLLKDRIRRSLGNGKVIKFPDVVTKRVNPVLERLQKQATK